MHVAIVITNAAREGARFGSMHPGVVGDIQAAAVAEAGEAGIDLAGPDAAIVVFCPNDGGPVPCPRGDPLRVEITYQFELITVGVFGGPDLPVYSYADMMVP